MSTKDLLEVALDNTEVFIDQYIDNEVIKDIPLLGTALKLVTAASDIRDRMFAAKIGKFLSSLDTVSIETKDKLRVKMQCDPEEAGKVGEIILLTLDRLSDLDKPEIISKIFIAYIDDYLDSTEFRRIVEAVDLAFTDDLIDLFHIQDIPRKSKEPALRNLARTGLSEVVGSNLVDDAGTIYYELTELGENALKAYKHGVQATNIE